MSISTENLQKIGFTDAEARLYFFVLHNPGFSTSEIARKLALSVSRISIVAKPLLEAKVLVVHTKGKAVFYAVGQYSNLVAFTESRNKKQMEEIKETELQLKKNLEESKNLAEQIKEEFSDPEEIVVDIYETEKEIESLKKDFLNESPREIIQLVNNKIKKQSYNKLKQKADSKQSRNIKNTLLYTGDKQSFVLEKDNVYLPFLEFSNIHASITIYENTLIFTAYRENRTPVFLVIHNKSIFKTVKNILEYLKNKNSR